jgi:hypothetical protein
MIRFFVSFASVSGIAGAGNWLAQGETQIAAALIGAALVLVALRLTVLSGRSLPRPRPDSVRAGALVVLLVTSAAIPGAVGSAAAQTTRDECAANNLQWTIDLVNPTTSAGELCTAVTMAIEDMKESDANQTKTDIYSAASGHKGSLEAWSAPYDNHLQDTDSVAWMKVETAVAEAYQNGSTKPEAKVKAREAIADYYATKQINLIEQYNVTLGQMQTLKEQAIMEDGINASFVYSDNGSKNGDVRITSVNYSRTGNMTLVNDTNRDVAAVNLRYRCLGNCGSQEGAGIYNPLTGDNYSVENFSAYNDEIWLEDISIESPDTNYNELDVMYFSNFTDRWAQIQNQNDNLQTEAENFVEATWQDFDAGAINSSDVISSHTAMFQYGVSGENGSEGLYRSTAALALMGYDTPNLSSSGMMTVEYRGGTKKGLVLAESAPGGSWEAGTTYNTSNFDGPVFMATENGTKVDFAEGETFTISSMTAKDGSELNQTDTTKYIYKTANTSEMLQLQEDMTELRQEIEDREASGGGGGGGGFDFDFGSGQSVPVLIAAAAAAVLLLKE